MTAVYERAGLTPAETEHLANLVGAAEASDPTVPWVAVERADLLGVVAALDRLVDATARVDTVVNGTGRPGSGLLPVVEPDRGAGPGRPDVHVAARAEGRPVPAPDDGLPAEAGLRARVHGELHVILLGATLAPAPWADTGRRVPALLATGPAEERTGDPDEDYLHEIGRRIRTVRLRRQIGQDRLAQLAAVSRVSLGSIERGEHSGGMLTYRKLARALGVDIGDLLREDTR